MRREADARRGSARERGYTSAWDKSAKAHLAAHPLCVYCAHGAFGEVRITAATLVDHFYPHRGDQALFWWRPGWTSSCAACHDGPKQAAEHAGEAALAALAQRIAAPARPSPTGVGGAKV